MVSLSDGTYPGRGAALGSFSSTIAAKSSMKVSFVFSAGTRPHCCKTSNANLQIPLAGCHVTCSTKHLTLLWLRPFRN